MRVVVLGASGGVGRLLVRDAAAAGHQVVALVRAGTPYAAPAGVQLVRGEALDATTLDEVLAGAGAVLSGVGMKRASWNPWSKATSPSDLNARLATLLIDGMRRAGVGRLVAVSAAGVGDSASAMGPLVRGLVVTSTIGAAYRDLEEMERRLLGSGLDVLLPRPTRLTDGSPTGHVRVASRFRAWDRISRADVAAWMVGALASDDLRAPPWDRRTPLITGG
jgi:uncharacterized protein YbjT (DUF2867 family)